MSNFDRSGRDPDYVTPTPVAARNSGPMIAGAVIVILAIVAIGYAFGGRLMGTTGMTDHRAAATDSAAPTTPPAPAPSASPAATPKP